MSAVKGVEIGAPLADVTTSLSAASSADLNFKSSIFSPEIKGVMAVLLICQFPLSIPPKQAPAFMPPRCLLSLGCFCPLGASGFEVASWRHECLDCCDGYLCDEGSIVCDFGFRG